ncbi:hypothetical protein ACFL1C_08920, partial [Pseudomonadota bacterium]
MNSRVCKWLVSFAVFFCLMFVAAGVAAKKPDNTGKPGMPDDPCSIEADFVPDFVFWRDSTRKRVPQVTIYMA